tara:strand:+ start:875 stop:2092 length:1218 start_codon:yes stop_codon:yes gene_type:complete
VKKNLIEKKNYIQKRYLNSISLKKFSNKFEKELKKINSNIKNPSHFFHLLNSDYNFNFDIKDLKKFKKFNTIAIIGMGGSILGAKAIYYFLRKKIKKKIYFFDDVNSHNIISFKKRENTQKVLFLVISKSGNTIETISNLLSLKIIKKGSQNIIIISEKNDNFLNLLSKKLDIFYIEHKKFIGGRFSVLTEVGIVPAYFMGINILKIRKNLSKFLKGQDKNYLKDSSIKLAYLINKKSFKNLVFLNYTPEVEKFLYWCQQLIAESLGKKGKGFFPVVSSVPKDHHSLLQLYLDGPKDNLFYIFHCNKKSKNKILVKNLSKKIMFLNNKSLDIIKKAQKNSLIKTLIKKGIPFREFSIRELNEETLGQLFSYFIIETIFIARLSNINPFNQPAVEQVKNYTKKLLS